MKIVTFNIRCVWKGSDGINDFIHRAGFIYDKIQNEKPDVIAFQEIVIPQLELLKKMLPEYEFFGSFRDEEYIYEGLFTAIKKDNLALMGGDVFWLSPTPYVAGSRFETQSIYPRVCVMTKVRNRQTHEIFRIYNVHLDHLSDDARSLGINCVFDFINEYNKKEKLPTVLLGDFNAFPDSETLKLCYSHSDYSDTTKNIPTSFHSYGQENEKIDYIFVSDEWKERVVETVAWKDCHEGIYLSDHYPLSLEIKNKKE